MSSSPSGPENRDSAAMVVGHDRLTGAIDFSRPFQAQEAPTKLALTDAQKRDDVLSFINKDHFLAYGEDCYSLLDWTRQQILQLSISDDFDTISDQVNVVMDSLPIKYLEVGVDFYDELRSAISQSFKEDFGNRDYYQKVARNFVNCVCGYINRFGIYDSRVFAMSDAVNEVAASNVADSFDHFTLSSLDPSAELSVDTSTYSAPTKKKVTFADDVGGDLERTFEIPARKKESRIVKYKGSRLPEATRGKEEIKEDFADLLRALPERKATVKVRENPVVKKKNQLTGPSDKVTGSSRPMSYQKYKNTSYNMQAAQYYKRPKSTALPLSIDPAKVSSEKSTTIDIM